MNLRSQNFYEPETTKNIYKHKTQKRKTSGPKNSVRKRQVFEHNTKSLMNLRPRKLYESKTPNKKLRTQGPKIIRTEGESHSMFCECPTPTPHQFFFFSPTSSAETAHPHLKRLHLQLKPQKKINSQNKKKLIPKIFPHP